MHFYINMKKVAFKYLLAFLLTIVFISAKAQSSKDTTAIAMDSLGGLDYAPAYHYKLNPYIAQCIEPILIDTHIWGPYNDDLSLTDKNLWAGLGNYGQAQQPINFLFTRQHDFNYKTLPYYNYIHNFSNWDLYTLPTTYANIAYNFVSTKENHFSANYAQHIIDDLTFNLNLETILAGGRYVNQKVRDLGANAGISYLTPNRRYGIKLYYSFNMLKLGENGGLQDDTCFSHAPGTSAVKHVAAGSQTRNHEIFLRHYLSLSPTPKDNKKPHNGGWLIHDFNFTTYRYHYYDYQPDSSYYDIFIFRNDSTMDTHRFHQVRNSVYWANYMPEDTLGSKPYFLHFAAGISHSFNQVIDTVNIFNNNNITPIGSIHARLFQRLELKANLMGTVFGYNAGDITVEGNVKIKLNKKDTLPPRHNHYIAADINFYNYQPDYMFTRYTSNNYLWSNNLKQQQTLHLQVLWNWDNYQIGLHYYTLHNYTALNENMQVQQWNKFANIYQFSAYIPLDIKGFGLHSKLYVQYCDQDFIRLPIVALKETMYYGFYMYQKALYLIFGVDFMYNTAYYANAYNPALQMFYLQNDTKIGNYGYLDVFVKAKINRFTLLAKLTHVWGNAFTQYYLTPHYPSKDFGFSIGVNWRFHD